MSALDNAKKLDPMERRGVSGGPEDRSFPSPEPSVEVGAATRPFITSFLEHLVRNKLITEEMALRAAKWRYERNIKDKRGVIDILVEEFRLPRDSMYHEVAKFYSFRIVELNERSERRIPSTLVHKLMSGLSEPILALAVKHKVLPFETAENNPDKLLVVTPFPSDREVYEVARAFAYKKFEICFMREKDWAEYWRQVSMDKQHVAGVNGDGLILDDEEDPELDGVLEKEITKGQLISLVEDLFSDAVRVGASDIHVVPRAPRRTEVYFRIDGDLQLWCSIEDSRAEAVVAVVKGRGIGLDRFERMAAQDGSGQKQVDNQLIRFRLSVLPIISRRLGGKFESIVIRILRDADASVSLESIGFDEYSRDVFTQAITQPHGLVILTGPTGSGKSTTLVAALRSVMTSTMNTITVEDPVEYILEGARQVKLNHKLNFDDAIRAILRHDPDIVMVGEIRDRITADIAIKLANTGHLTFSTLHTNDAPSAISRLFKMGVEPFLIAQALNIVVAQRLVRRLCESCKVPGPKPPDHLLTRAGFSKEDIARTKFYKSVGCIKCVAGFKGRTAIHESLYVTPEMREVVIDSGEKIDTSAIREMARSHGMKTLRESGVELVKRGLTSLDEIIEATSDR